RVRLQGLVYRAHNPRWAFSPTSGEGAARHGGRFNPVGVPALYMSRRMETAWLEAQQGFAFKAQPLTRLIQLIAGIQKRVLYKPLSSRHELASRLSRSPARRESCHVRPLWLSRRAPVQLSDRSSQEGRGG